MERRKEAIERSIVCIFLKNKEFIFIETNQYIGTCRPINAGHVSWKSIFDANYHFVSYGCDANPWLGHPV